MVDGYDIINSGYGRELFRFLTSDNILLIVDQLCDLSQALKHR